MSYYSQNVFVKIWLILNVILGMMTGSFFAYENFKTCGDIFVAGTVVGFIFSLINLILLGFQQAWRMFLHIILIIILITFSIMAFILISQVNKQSLCDNQWCVSQGVDFAQILSQISDETEKAICQKDTTQQQNYVFQLSKKQDPTLRKTDVWNIDNSIPLAFSSMQGSICLLMCILLIADIFKQRKIQQKKDQLI
ncbi:hypothetical protein ABPG74_012536 [Tetrahymena malaccensis]